MIIESNNKQATQRKAHRAYKTLSACNHELIRATCEMQLLRDMCRVLVQQGGYRMAWVGYLEHDAEKNIRPVAQNGFEEGYLETAKITWADNEHGQGPTGRAARSGLTQTAQSMLHDYSLSPWQAEAIKRGYAASIALSLVDEGCVFGVFTIYSAEANAFDQDEVGLLEQLSADLAFGIGLLRQRQEQRRVTEQLRTSLEQTISAIAAISDMRDPYTAGHERRVADLAAAIATEMGLPEKQIRGIYLAATVHDLGKIQMPIEILSKPGRLNEMEFGLVKGHAQAGFDILKDIDFPWPIAQIVLQHHERMDGSGYPQGLKGEVILLEARILAVADVVEAMASHRPYRPGLGLEVALDEISKNRGTFYDSAAVDTCIKLFREKNYLLPKAVGQI